MADRKITELSALTAPATGDLLPVVDISEAASVDKNKSITVGTLFRTLGNGSAGAPALSFLSDTGTSGIYRSGTNEVAFSAASIFQGKFTSAGFQLGTGTAAAQLHLFSSDTTDQVIIENNDAGLDTAPDLVLYRNSATPAANDNLGNIEFRGEDDGGNTHAYAQILAQVSSPTDSAEVGILDLMSSAAGSNETRIRLKGQYVGIGETNPAYKLHLTNTAVGASITSECSFDSDDSGADIKLLRRRGASGAGQDNDTLSTIFYKGKNDNATPEEIDYAAIEASIIDASDALEDGRLRLQVQTEGTLKTQLEVGPDQLFIGSEIATDAATISTVNFRGKNDAGIPEEINYSALVATVVDNADGAEDGRLQVQTMSGGTLATRLDIDENKIGFFGATAAVQQPHEADLTVTATTGTLPTADGSVTIADAAAPTNAELLEYCVELEAKVEALLAFASAHGLMASS